MGEVPVVSGPGVWANDRDELGGARTSDTECPAIAGPGMGETKLTLEFPTLRGGRGIAVALLSLIAVTAAGTVADARHIHPKHRTAHSETSSPPYAAIVVDANSGSVLHSANPDELRHPASLTKIMTLYLLFERLEAGKLKPDTPLDVSEHAAAQAPSKLGLKPDQSIEVEDAIGALVTKSANDVAVVIAEAVAGNEHDFADVMTRKARALGMSHTIYRNASGLPDDAQVTTARDQALLGRAIQERFPQYYRYFATRSYSYRGTAMRNHNHLLGRVEGLDGIKTGYTEASGYNLVTSVRRNGRHIISVVLGGASAGARDARMRKLIEEFIVAAATQKSPTAIAEAGGAKETPSAEPRTSEGRAAVAHTAEATSAKDARAANRRAAELRTADAGAPSRPGPATPDAGASHSRLTSPPEPSARVATAGVPMMGGDFAPTATLPAQAAKPSGIGSDPIKPIQVKTVKVKLPPTQIAALAPSPNFSAPEETPAPQVPQNAVPQIAAPQNWAPQDRAPQDRASVAAPKATAPSNKPATFVVASVPNAAPAAAKREIARENLLETARDGAAPQSPSSPSRPPPSVPSQSMSVHSGWIIQVGAFEAEREAKQKLSAVQAKAAPMLGRADPFTEPVVKGDKTLYRARFAGLQKNEAEAICRQLKRNDIDCMTIKN
jgi:D-alanyl-D-alanine carboxypeptidase